MSEEYGKAGFGGLGDGGGRELRNGYRFRCLIAAQCLARIGATNIATLSNSAISLSLQKFHQTPFYVVPKLAILRPTWILPPPLQRKTSTTPFTLARKTAIHFGALLPRQDLMPAPSPCLRTQYSRNISACYISHSPPRILIPQWSDLSIATNQNRLSHILPQSSVDASLTCCRGLWADQLGYGL